jgi:tight adherence protein B
MVGLAVALTFTAIFLLALALLFLGDSAIQSPMRRLRRRLNAVSGQNVTIDVFRDVGVSSLASLQHFLSRAVFAQQFQRYLEQAGIAQRVGTILGMVLLLAFLGAWIAWRLTSSLPLSAIGLGVVGCLPLLYIRRQRRLRLALYAEQLPDCLDLLSRSLRAGQSFLHGVQSVAEEMPEPAKKEWRATFEELRLGRNLREALKAHSDRVENLDFNLLSTALMIQREVGGNLTEILENTSMTIRDRFKLLGQIDAISAQNRLGAKIVGALPLAMTGIVYLLNPDFIMVLFREEMGQKLVVAAIIMQLTGYYVMKRIVTIKI